MSRDFHDSSLIPSYHPVPTALLFHASDKFVRGLKGPVGSSKSSACANELLMRAFRQEPWTDGVRRTRYAIIRRTYSELLSTTIKTWQDWCPERVMHLNMSPPPQGRMIHKCEDGTTVDMEVIFLALDEEKDVDKLRSLELTMAWINEAKEIQKVHLDMATSRIGRYPAKRLGGPTFSGIILDTNPPHDQSWWYEVAEIEKPDNFEFFDQPPALLEVPRKNDDEPIMFVPNKGQEIWAAAENIDNLPNGFQYYLDMLGGKDLDWIRVNIQGFYGRVIDGKPVYPEYNDDIHAAKGELRVFKGLPLIVGLDFGLNPSAVFCQMSPMGQLRAIDECWSEDLGVRSFVRDILLPHIRNNYPGMVITYITDPAGNQRGETDETTCLQVLQECGISAEMAPTNLFTPRREAVAFYMLQMRDGQPGFVIGPKCKRLRTACKGAYRYRMRRTSGGVTYAPRPDKYDKYTHISDALQYAALIFKGGYVMGQGEDGTMGDDASSVRAREIEVVNADGWT